MMLISKTRVKKHSNCVTFSYQKKIFRYIDKNFLTVNDISNKLPVESEKREETFRIGLIRSYGKLLRIPEPLIKDKIITKINFVDYTIVL